MSGGDRVLSWFVLCLTTALGVDTIGRPPQPEEVSPPAVIEETLEARVADIAQAIALAEGYYASGEHDGHSLPYRLNNPGALKKPALGAADLPTWQDTGLVVFPSTALGWAALRHQVRLMLSGGSRIYDPSDTIATVAAKYTGGDASAGWSARVAATLGVPAVSTLADLVAADR